MLHLFSSLCIGRFVSLLANFYNKAVNSDAIEDSESMDIIGEFIANHVFNTEYTREKPCYKRSILVLKPGNVTFPFPKSIFWAFYI